MDLNEMINDGRDQVMEFSAHITGQVAGLLDAISTPVVDGVAAVSARVQELVPAVGDQPVPDVAGLVAAGFEIAKDALATPQPNASS